MTATAVINQQAFAAPQGTALAVPEAIECQTNHRPTFQWPAVLGETSGQMCMMMQYRGYRQ
ncbi:hypothetical protein D3C79_941790 [compost metagenome]